MIFMGLCMVIAVTVYLFYPVRTVAVSLRFHWLTEFDLSRGLGVCR